MSPGFFIVISGPTGVGKTDFVHELIAHLPYTTQIINADVGQMYTPLSIGTAKPDYRQGPVKQHLFDILDEPRDYTVADFRKEVKNLMQQLWDSSVVPIIVGGSSFYIQSLFFPPLADEGSEHALPDSYSTMTNQELWQELLRIDPDRAASIHPHDRYRVERALALWHSGGKLPSLLVPLFEPLGTCAFYYLTRDRAELNERINERVHSMLAAGWIDEVRNLDHAWRTFLLKKKLIGYRAIIEFLNKSGQVKLSLNELEDQISLKTRAYAKRQLTFWRMMKQKLEEADPEHAYLKIIKEINLTLSPDKVYLEQLSTDMCWFAKNTKK